MTNNNSQLKVGECNLNEFLELFAPQSNQTTQTQTIHAKETFRGINRLAELLDISYRTALKIKNSGSIEYMQPSERVFIFRYSDVFSYKGRKKLNK